MFFHSPSQQHSSHSPIQLLAMSAAGRWLWAAVAVLVVAVGYALLLRPVIAQLAGESGAQMVEYTAVRDAKKTELQAIQTLLVEYENIEANEKEKLSKILPDHTAIPQLLAQLEALFASEELIMTGISAAEIEPKTDTQNYRVVGLQIGFSGIDDYFSFKRLLEKFESHIRLLNITSVSYVPDNSEFVVSAEAYYLAPTE